MRKGRFRGPFFCVSSRWLLCLGDRGDRRCDLLVLLFERLLDDVVSAGVLVAVVRTDLRLECLGDDFFRQVDPNGHSGPPVYERN